MRPEGAAWELKPYLARTAHPASEAIRVEAASDGGLHYGVRIHPFVDAFLTWCATNTVKLPETAFLYAEGLATAACCRSHRSSSPNRIRPVS